MVMWWCVIGFVWMWMWCYVLLFCLYVDCCYLLMVCGVGCCCVVGRCWVELIVSCDMWCNEKGFLWIFVDVLFLVCNGYLLVCCLES